MRRFVRVLGRALAEVRSQRGTVVLLTLGFMVFLLAMGGFAVDIAYQMTVTSELQKSMEAASLAGAGKLGFNDTVFPTVRTWAQQYASFNPHHNPLNTLINLNLNTANSPSGDIVLGVWANGNFTPSVDGSLVNAVRCQWQATIPTTFLRVLGITALPVSAQAIAVANPPQNPPPAICMFPIGLSSCFFGGATSLGCGATVTLISSSDQSAVGANTAAWVSMTACPGCQVNANATRQAVNAAGAGNCPSDLQTGSTVAANNGMINSAHDDAFDLFIQKYNASPVYTVYKQDGTTIAYQGKGWDPRCLVDKNGTATDLDPGVSGSRGIFGYYDCTYIPSPPATEPVPRTALGTRLRLVKTR